MKAKSSESESLVVTEDEAALYDRQIRLWGLPAQKRLRGSRVLVAGIKGLGAEVCKNIVLAGIKSLTVLDHTLIDAEDGCSQFFSNKTDIGTNRALCSLPKIQQLNPTVEVVADTDDVRDKEDDYFVQFDIVCLTNCPVDIASRIDDVCRQKRIKFMMGAVHGMFGYAFMDFGEHEYQDDDHSAVNEDAKSPPSKKAKRSDGNPETNTKKISYVSLQQALSVKRVNPTNKKRLAKWTNSYFIMKGLHEFQNKYGRNPSLVENDADLLSGIFQEHLQTEFDEKLPRCCLAECSPVCAIVGGVYAQEIIKALSCSDATYNNFFFYNALNGTGVVECFGTS